MLISYQFSTLQDYEIKQLLSFLRTGHHIPMQQILLERVVAGHFPIADNCLRHMFEVLAKSEPNIEMIAYKVFGNRAEYHFVEFSIHVNA